jgi:nucleoside-diphosphate-sugar epimerase
MTINRTALVLGATGGIGGEVAKLLLARGWNVRALHRHPDTLPAERKTPGLQWLRGDAMSATDVIRAASGVSAIVPSALPSRRERPWVHQKAPPPDRLSIYGLPMMCRCAERVRAHMTYTPVSL